MTTVILNARGVRNGPRGFTVLELVLSSKESAANTDSLVVNITSNTLASKTFLPWLGEELACHRFAAQRLVLELLQILSRVL